MKTDSKTVAYSIWPSNKCNMDCDHCFLSTEVKKDNKTLTIEEFKKIARECADNYSKNPEYTFAEVTVLGGEPTLLPPMYLEEVMTYLRDCFKKTNKKFIVMMVTNFTNLSQLRNLSHVFDKIITSYEYERFAETNSKNNKYNNLWHKNVNQWVLEGRDLGISLALTKDTCKNIVKILDDLYSMGIRQYGVIPLYPKWLNCDDDSVKQHNADYALESKALQDITDWWLNKINQGESKVSIYPIEHYVEAVVRNTVPVELSWPTCQNEICITPNGDVMGCGIEVGNESYKAVGNILDKKLSEIGVAVSESKRINKFCSPLVECMYCEYYNVCRGGCLYRAAFWDRTEEQECHGNKSYLRHLEINKERYTPITDFFANH